MSNFSLLKRLHNRQIAHSISTELIPGLGIQQLARDATVDVYRRNGEVPSELSKTMVVTGFVRNDICHPVTVIVCTGTVRANQ
jgi:hypothetical protein